MSDTEPPKDDATNEVSLEDEGPSTTEVSLDDDDAGGDLASEMFGGADKDEPEDDDSGEITATGGDAVEPEPTPAPKAASPKKADAAPVKPYTFSIKISDPERIGACVLGACGSNPCNG